MKTIHAAELAFYSECFTCDFEAGVLFRNSRPASHFKTMQGMKLFNSRYAGQQIIAKNPKGYITVKIGKKNMLAHRIIYFLYHSEWPQADIDHINGIRNDNRIVNLRAVNRSINQQNQRAPRSNNTTGFLGVSHRKDLGKYRASIGVDGIKRSLGVFDTPELAHAAYVEEKRKIHVGCTI